MAQRPIQVRGLEKESPVDKPVDTVTQKTKGLQSTHLARASDAITQRVRIQPVAPSPLPSCSPLNQDSLSLNPCSCRAGVYEPRWTVIDSGLSLSQGRPIMQGVGEYRACPLLRVEQLPYALHCSPGNEQIQALTRCVVLGRNQ